MDYNLLKTFCKVVEAGSFNKAAAILNQPKSRVSRTIARLENELGVSLISRTTRRSTLTRIGEVFYKKILPHLNGINEELDNISDKKDGMTGTIRLTASDSLSQTILAQVILEFNLKYPEINFEMIITNDYLDLVKEDIDLAFRAGKLKDSALIQKKFIPVSFILVCSKKYLSGSAPLATLEDIQHHKFLSFKPMEIVLNHKGLKINKIVTTNSLPLLLSMALNGDGVTLLPDFLCQKHFDAKNLIRVIPTWKSKTENIHILYRPTKNLSKKVKTFIDHLFN